MTPQRHKSRRQNLALGLFAIPEIKTAAGFLVTAITSSPAGLSLITLLFYAVLCFIFFG
jgi:hypothetical protein